MDPSNNVREDHWLAQLNTREASGKFENTSHPLFTSCTPEHLLNETLFASTGFDKPIMCYEGMTIVSNLPGPVHVSTFAKLIGDNEPVRVIDITTQSELTTKWTMKKWTNYFENPKRKRILNVISLEFSHTSLRQYVDAPAVVKQIDFYHKVWPKNTKVSLPSTGSDTANGSILRSKKSVGPAVPRLSADDKEVRLDYPKVQYYLLMGAAGSFTDFHIDFGGSSVWYHVLKGQKIFYLLPPTSENLKAYEDWTSNPNQDSVFFTDTTPGPTIKCVVNPGNTLFIPPGWIHAVYTPKDSYVVGGNFLHKFGIDMQIKVFDLETQTDVPFHSRFPFFIMLHWYWLDHYVNLLLKKAQAANTTTLPDNHMTLQPAGEIPTEASPKLFLPSSQYLPHWERKGLIALCNFLPTYPYLCPNDIGNMFVRNREYVRSNYPEYLVAVVQAYLEDALFPTFDEYLRNKKLSTVPRDTLFESTTATGDTSDPKTKVKNLYCICQVPEEARDDWIGCDDCLEWFHCKCMGVTLKQRDLLESFYCPTCANKNGWTLPNKISNKVSTTLKAPAPQKVHQLQPTPVPQSKSRYTAPALPQALGRNRAQRQISVRRQNISPPPERPRRQQVRNNKTRSLKRPREIEDQDNDWTPDAPEADDEYKMDVVKIKETYKVKETDKAKETEKANLRDQFLKDIGKLPKRRAVSEAQPLTLQQLRPGEKLPVYATGRGQAVRPPALQAPYSLRSSEQKQNHRPLAQHTQPVTRSRSSLTQPQTGQRRQSQPQQLQQAPQAQQAQQVPHPESQQTQQPLQEQGSQPQLLQPQQANAQPQQLRQQFQAQFPYLSQYQKVNQPQQPLSLTQQLPQPNQQQMQPQVTQYQQQAQYLTQPIQTQSPQVTQHKQQARYHQFLQQPYQHVQPQVTQHQQQQAQYLTQPIQPLQPLQAYSQQGQPQQTQYLVQSSQPQSPQPQYQLAQQLAQYQPSQHTQSNQFTQYQQTQQSQSQAPRVTQHQAQAPRQQQVNTSPIQAQQAYQQVNTSPIQVQRVNQQYQPQVMQHQVQPPQQAQAPQQHQVNTSSIQVQQAYQQVNTFPIQVQRVYQQVNTSPIPVQRVQQQVNTSPAQVQQVQQQVNTSPTQAQQAYQQVTTSPIQVHQQSVVQNTPKVQVQHAQQPGTMQSTGVLEHISTPQIQQPVILQNTSTSSPQIQQQNNTSPPQIQQPVVLQNTSPPQIQQPVVLQNTSTLANSGSMRRPQPPVGYRSRTT